MTSNTEPKIAPPVTLRKLRAELCALQEELAGRRRRAETQAAQVDAMIEETERLKARLSETAAHATRCALQRDAARGLLKSVWEAATEGDTPFFQRLAQLQRFGRQVGEELLALEKGEGNGGQR